MAGAHRLHPRRHPVAFTLALLATMAFLTLPDFTIHLYDRGYFTFGLPESLPQVGGHRAPSQYHSHIYDTDIDIYSRSNDAAPLRLGEVFQGDARRPSHEDLTFTMRGVRMDSDCAAAVWGKQLRAVLRAGDCSQIVRGLYADMDNELLGFVAILNMRDAEAAERIVKQLDPDTGAGFVLPLRGRGQLGDLGLGYSTADGNALGHFVFLTWVQRLSGSGSESPPDRELRRARVALGDARDAIVERGNDDS